jgi:hypothetical protein
MKIGLCCKPLCLVLSVAGLSALAQTNEAPENRFNLSYRAGFNIKADFKNLGRAGVPGGPSVTGLSYEDGFVRPNSVPNNLDLSWNWGYQNASQVVGDNIVMTSSQRGNLAKDQDDTPANGVELSYNRRLGWWGKAAWGLEGAVNYTGLEIANNSTPAGNVLTAHAFNLGGAIPPTAPYSGTPDGPGILISETPTAASLAVHSRLETTLLGFRLGPSIEFPFGEQWSVGLSGGFALAWADSDVHFREVVSLSGTQTALRSAGSSSSDWLPGFYLGANVAYKVCSSGSFFIGAQFQDVGDQTVRALDKQAKLDLSQSIFLNAGFSYSF